MVVHSGDINHAEGLFNDLAVTANHATISTMINQSTLGICLVFLDTVQNVVNVCTVFSVARIIIVSMTRIPILGGRHYRADVTLRNLSMDMCHNIACG